MSKIATGVGLSLVAAAGFALVALAARPAFADADVGKEISTASQHAGLAAKATDMKTTQMHLHHVVNCLVGPSGKGFDGSFGNPCNGQGNGAIADNSDAKTKPVLAKALREANAGLKSKDMAGAQKQAVAIQTTLKPAGS